MSFWGAGGETSSWRWRGFNKTTNRGAGKDEERADRTLFHLLNLIMEIRNISDCFAAYVFVPAFRCVYMSVSAADDWGWREIQSSTVCRTRAVTVALWFSDVYLMPRFYSFTDRRSTFLLLMSLIWLFKTLSFACKYSSVWHPAFIWLLKVIWCNMTRVQLFLVVFNHVSGSWDGGV